ncbi:aldehyde dehydrogenase family protein [Nocardioides alcanivorans]|uniref:aldehyde dehydrogenase family protein n=1 Tax=Nocardioides alcanivorans TaxID=2897352 RepID=UPI001F47A942|nr:aldehyde dehydrogenase family protein [Nocardioides alcanivorans]
MSGNVMDDVRGCLIDGRWQQGTSGTDVVLTSAADGTEMTRFSGAGRADAERAVAAARAAWPAWASLSVGERGAILLRTADLLEKRAAEIAQCCALEIGSPLMVAAGIHAHLPAAAIRDVVAQAEQFRLEEEVGNSLVIHEPAGVAVAITAWNYPLYQFATKVAPALAAGCTVVAKPSELAPLSTIIFFEALVEAGLPTGVANLVIGTGPDVGEPLVTHPDVDVVSFTGSTKVGQRIGELAAPGVKRVALELGGKSANVILDDADLAVAVPESVRGWLVNNSQTCAALTRLVVPRTKLAEIEEALVDVLAASQLGHPLAEGTTVGPVISAAQRDRVVGYIESGLAEGARLLAGGPERPAELPDRGNYVSPTVFTDVTPDMRIAQEEIFGPVLCVIPVDSEDEAVAVANGTPYGLSGAVWAGTEERAMSVARRLRTGQVAINGGGFNLQAPFGGYKLSGVGREGGRFGLAEYFETKAIQR